VGLLNRLRKEADELEKSLIEIAVYSNGSIGWQDAYMMSSSERATAVKVINNYNRIKSGKPAVEEM
jgi:N-acetylglucosamine-6-phosphate deacetylase